METLLYSVYILALQPSYVLWRTVQFTSQQDFRNCCPVNNWAASVV